MTDETIELPVELVSDLLNLMVALDAVAEQLPPEIIAMMNNINTEALH